MRTLLTCSMLTCAALVHAQSEFQLLLDNAPSSLGSIRHGVVTNDGHLVLAFPSSDSTSFWTADGNGVPVASFEIAQENRFGSRLVATADGGFLYATLAPEIVEEHPEGDTLGIRVQITHANPDGTVQWSKEVVHKLGVYEYFALFYASFELLVDGDGFFIYLRGSENINQICRLTKHDQNGSVLWSKEMDMPNVPFASVWNRLCPSGDGGVFMTIPEPVGTPFYRLCKINAEGSIEWMRKFEYVNDANTSELNHMILGPDGGPTLIGGFAGSTFNYSITFHVGPDGNSHEAHFYTQPAGTYMGFRKAMIGPGNGLVLQTDNDQIMELASDGSIAHQVRLSSVTANDIRLTATVHDVFPVGDQAVVFGGMTQEDLVFGAVSRSPIIWRTDLDPAEDCFIGPLVLEHIPVPDEMFMTTEEPGFTTEDAPYETISRILEPVSIQAPVVLDACELLPTGIDGPESSARRDLLNTLVLAGEPLLFATGDTRRTTILDATGRIVRGTTVHTGSSATISTLGWPSGVYLVHITDADGGRVRTQRVVVQ